MFGHSEFCPRESHKFALAQTTLGRKMTRVCVLGAMPIRKTDTEAPLTELMIVLSCSRPQHGQPKRELYTMLILRGALQSRARVLTTQDMQARDLQSRFGRRTVHLQRNDIMLLKCKWDVDNQTMKMKTYNKYANENCARGCKRLITAIQ
jgi:hypothetical protein